MNSKSGKEGFFSSVSKKKISIQEELRRTVYE